MIGFGVHLRGCELDQAFVGKGWGGDGVCRNSLLYKGSEDDDELGLEVTGWAWNKRTKTRTMITATRRRVKGSMVAVRLRLWGVDKRTV